MTLTTYRKKPEIVEAIQVTGENAWECVSFLGDDVFKFALSRNKAPEINDYLIKSLTALGL